MTCEFSATICTGVAEGLRSNLEELGRIGTNA